LFGILFVQGAPATGGRILQVENKPATAETSSMDVRPILVELFTSEGCSSYPPADALLETMDNAQPVPGAELIVLSEHVDYWDHDGWKDPNSSPALSERRNAYVHALGLQTAYSPQMIVDETRELLANDPQQRDKFFHEAAAAFKVPARICEISVDAGDPTILRARIEADGSSDKNNAEAYVAVALDRVVSRVLRGENGDRRLTHVAVVQQ
jgi:hypothetical protein